MIDHPTPSNTFLAIPHLSSFPWILLAVLLAMSPTSRAASTQPTNAEPSSTPDSGAEATEVAEDFRQSCLDEVDALHRFFQDWFNGDLPDTDEAFARFADALDTDFAIVAPSGHLAERERLLGLLRPQHGRYSGDHDAKVWIENAEVRRIDGDRALVTYEEWQKVLNASGVTIEPARGRLSTALLRLDPEAPGGIRWLHVHETWLPE